MISSKQAEMASTAEVIAGEARYLVQTYVRPARVFTHGEGAYLFDAAGKRYLDFAAGIAVNSLGHADPEWAQAVAEQAGRLAHVSNLYHTAEHVQLAQRLVEHSFADRVFFCNSGTEANEAALKFARKYALVRAAGAAPGTRIIAFEHGFHGRTIGALSVTAKAQYREPFEPLMPDVCFLPLNDVGALAAAFDGHVCAAIVEPLQGEGGVNPASAEFLRELRRLCDECGALLIFDEVQCGLGRTGSLWAHTAANVYPDIMTLAKPLAGGLPIGAVLVTDAVAAVLQPGDHGSTFAAGPLVCRAAQVVFDRVSDPAFLMHVAASGKYLRDRLLALELDHMVEVRGAGLLLGVEFSVAVKPLIGAAAECGLLLITAGDNVLRLCPPLIVDQAQIDFAVETIGSCWGALQ